MTPLASLAQVRIGLQSFAKMFYIVPRQTQKRWQLERRWLLPFIMSPKDVEVPYLSPETPIRHYIVACDASPAQLGDTHLLHYIQYRENQVLNTSGLTRPGSVGDVPVLDVRRLSPTTLHRLEEAYRQFLGAGGKDRMALDAAVLAALDLPKTFCTTLQATLDSMQELSSAVQGPVSVDAA